MSDVTAQNIIERTLIDYDDQSTSAYYKMRRIVEALEAEGFAIMSTANMVTYSNGDENGVAYTDGECRPVKEQGQ